MMQPTRLLRAFRSARAWIVLGILAPPRHARRLGPDVTRPAARCLGQGRADLAQTCCRSSNVISPGTSKSSTSRSRPYRTTCGHQGLRDSTHPCVNSSCSTARRLPRTLASCSSSMRNGDLVEDAAVTPPRKGKLRRPGLLQGPQGQSPSRAVHRSAHRLAPDRRTHGKFQPSHR